MRQARGGVLRELRRRDRAATIHAIAAGLGFSVPRVDVAVDALEHDGLVQRTASGRVRLAR
jgi:Mn-dependent DtxR family transcriptional regulator